MGGGLLIEPRLKEIVRDESPDILFLCETISKCDVVSDQAVVLGFDNVFSVPPVGRSGGLAILEKRKSILRCCAMAKGC